MKNKGFTLVELLAIIGILSIITLITIPTIDSTIKKNKEKLYDQQIETIRNGLKTWGDANVDRLPEESGETLAINLGYIKGEGFVKPDLINPKNKLCFANDMKLYIKRVNENYEYIVDTESGSNPTDQDCNGGDLEYSESILNGADPVLTGDLIPVVTDSRGGVTKADIYSKWYSYEEKSWANAVILKEGAEVQSDGTIIYSDVESFFVWIPRYRYKLFDMGEYNSYINSAAPETSNIKQIEIEFENKFMTDESYGTQVGEYHSHPAFQAFDTNGFWVAKFETAGTVDNIEIAYNKFSLTNLSVKKMFETAYNYKRNSNSHMMKNTEWGAVSYLALSKYGINKELNINSLENRAGYGYCDGPATSFNSDCGKAASTTGNITGIYDMNGSAHEYMASFIDGYLGNSGFDTDPTTIYGNKYFDKYSSISTTYKNRILGDATGEMGPFYYYADGDGTSRPHNSWYPSTANFIGTSASWFRRGGSYQRNAGSGILNFDRASGKNYTNTGFRIVLAK